MPYDTQQGGSLVYARRDFLQMTYESFCLLIGQGIAEKIASFPQLRQEAARLTGFWDRHDAILCRLRQEEEKQGNRDTGK